MSMRLIPVLAAWALLAACDSSSDMPVRESGEPDVETAKVPQRVDTAGEEVTPMAEREAVIGLLNKRNGISRDLRMRPGEAVRVDGEVIVRLSACEKTAPWEDQDLTGAFLQLDVRNSDDRYERVFSGWVYKESPSLNVVEHPVYDVWPKSCAMRFPGEESSVDEDEEEEEEESSASSAVKSPPREVSSNSPSLAT